LAYQNITINWEERLSPSASEYGRLQYSINGADFVDLGVITITNAGSFQTQSNSLAAIAEVNDNPNFAFRIVTEFESTAAGTANDNYVTATTNGYTAGGTIRFDLMTVSGDPIPGANTAPTISRFGNQTIRQNSPTDALAFTLTD